MLGRTILVLFIVATAPAISAHLVRTVTVRAGISTSTLQVAVRFGAFDSTYLLPRINPDGDSSLNAREFSSAKLKIMNAIADNLSIKADNQRLSPDAAAIGIASLTPGTTDPLELSCLFHYSAPPGHRFHRIMIDPNLFRDAQTTQTGLGNGHPVVLTVDCCGQNQVIPSFGGQTFSTTIDEDCPAPEPVVAPGVEWVFSTSGTISNMETATPPAETPAASTPVLQKSEKTAFSFFHIIYFFLVQGIMHILTGWDHIFFVTGLVLVANSFRNLVRVITAFTISHSMTLLITTGNIITINRPELVEAGIALSIAYIGLENLVKKGNPGQGRWLVAFLFGLIHGCGFAGALKEDIGHYIPNSTGLLVLCLLMFNVGVEIGQLLVILVFYPAMSKLRKVHFRTAKSIALAGSVIVLFMGVSWFLDRTFLPGKIPWTF